MAENRFVGDMTWGKFIPGYVVLTLLAIVAVLALNERAGLPPRVATCLVTAAFFAWAALGWPRYIYLLVRNIGWFAAIESDRAMRRTLWALTLLLLGVAAYSWYT